MTQGNKNVGWVSDSVTQQNRSQTTDQEANVLGYAALSQSKSGLPKGWVYARIGDVAAKTVQRVPHEKDEFIYVDIGSIDRNLKIISEPQTLLGKDAPSRARKIINTGDILVSLTRPNLNAVALIEQEFDNQIASTGFEVIKPILVDSRYIFAIVRSNEFIDAISKKVQGALYPAAKSDDVRQYEFLLPPLAEQHQIAAKLDELMAQVDSIKTRLDTIPKILKRFRQSVLAAAVSGKLTEDWREENFDLLNGKSGRFVIERIQEKKLAWTLENNQHNEVSRIRKRIKSFSEKVNNKLSTLPESWAWANLEDLVLMVVDCHNKTAPYQIEGIALVRTSNIRDGRFIWDDLRYVSEETYDYWSRRCKPERGDVIFTREAPMGEAAIITEESKICLGQRTMLFRPMEDEFSAKFLLIALMDPIFRKRSESIAVGTGVKHYRVGDVSELGFPVPSVEEQTEIVRRVEQLFTYADQIEQRVKDAQARVNHLTQSILAKAFRGELTADWRAQNPDLISGENSAEALLAKIQAQRLKEKPKTGRKARA
jgi:type I restriction enzyme S subunit